MPSSTVPSTTTIRQAIIARLSRGPAHVGELADLIRGEPMPPGTNGRQEPFWKATFDELWAMDAEGLTGFAHVGGWRLKGGPRV